MKTIGWIIMAGTLVNAVQWYRLREARTAETPPRKPILVRDTGPHRGEAAGRWLPPLEMIPAADSLEPALREQAQSLAQRLDAVPSPRRGDAVRDPERILAEADLLPVSAYLQFARDVLAASAREGAGSSSDPDLVILRLAERDPAMAFNWFLSEPALHASEKWKRMGTQLLTWWTLKDPASARRWIESSRVNPRMEPPSAKIWLEWTVANYAGALAGTLPEEAAPMIAGIKDSNAWSPSFREALSASLTTPAQRAAFVSALNRQGGDWSGDSSLMYAVLSAAGENGGTVDEFCRICETLPGEPDKIARSIAAAFNCRGGESEFIRWARSRFHETSWMVKLASDWIETNPAAVTQWMSAETPGPLRDAAVHGVNRELSRVDPGAALKWSLTVADPVKRRVLCRTIYTEWSAATPDQAEAGFRAEGLDPAVFEREK